MVGLLFGQPQYSNQISKRTTRLGRPRRIDASLQYVPRMLPLGISNQITG